MKVERFISDFMEDDRAFEQTLRICDNCGKLMNEGFLCSYVYYCSEECLYKHVDKIEWLLMYLDIGMDVVMDLIPDWDELTEDERIEELDRLCDDDHFETSDECYYTTWEDTEFCTRFCAEAAKNTNIDFRNKNTELDKPINGILFLEPHEMTVLIEKWINDKKSLPRDLQAVCNEGKVFTWLDNSSGDCWIEEYDDMESLLKEYYKGREE